MIYIEVILLCFLAYLGRALSVGDALLWIFLYFMARVALDVTLRWYRQRLATHQERALRPYGTGAWGGLAEAPPAPDTDASGMRCLGCGYYDDGPEAAQVCEGGAGHVFVRVGPDGQTLEPETTKGSP